MRECEVPQATMRSSASEAPRPTRRSLLPCELDRQLLCDEAGRRLRDLDDEVVGVGGPRDGVHHERRSHAVEFVRSQCDIAALAALTEQAEEPRAPGIRPQAPVLRLVLVVASELEGLVGM